MHTLGGNIRALRKAQGLTQGQLAEKLFVTRQTISNWETGVSQPGVHQLDAIAAALNTPPETLLGSKPAAPYRPRTRRLAAAAVLLALTAALPLCEWFVAPLLAGHAAVTYNVYRMALYTLLLRPLLQAAAGALLPALLALGVPLRLPARWRRCCLILAGGLVLVWAYTALPMLLPWLPGGMPPFAYPLSVCLYHTVSPLFSLAGIALYLGAGAKAP